MTGEELDALDRECAEAIAPDLAPLPFSPTRSWEDFGVLLLHLVEKMPDLQPTITYSREKLVFYAALRDADPFVEDPDPMVALCMAVAAREEGK